MVPQVILWEEICVEWGRGLAVLDLMMDVQLTLLEHHPHHNLLTHIQ